MISVTEQLESVSLPSSSAEAGGGPSTETPSGSGKVYKAGERAKTPFTLPKYDPSPPSSTGHTEARLKVRLARLQLEAHEQEAQAQLQLEMRKIELQAETERAVRLRQLELETSDTGRSAPRGSGMSPPSTSSPNVVFDISKHLAMVPVFRDNEVDSYFNVFERIAAALQWPREVWTLLLQCKMHGKAQDAR